MRKISVGVGLLGLLLMVINIAGSLTWPVRGPAESVFSALLFFLGVAHVVPAAGLFIGKGPLRVRWALWLCASAFILLLNLFTVPELLDRWRRL